VRRVYVADEVGPRVADQSGAREAVVPVNFVRTE